MNVLVGTKCPNLSTIIFATGHLRLSALRDLWRIHGQAELERWRYALGAVA